MDGQGTVCFSTLALAEQDLTMAVGTLFYTATKMMKSTCTNMALRAIVGQQTELRFVSEGNLPLDSFHT